MTAQDVITATKDNIGSVGAAYYFHRDTVARGKELGLDGMRFYVLGRGGVLGNVEAPVITSAFGYFTPAVIDKLWNSARQKLEPRQAATEHLECARALGRAKLGDVDGLEWFNQAAESVIAAMHPAGLALFAGFAAEPLPDDAPGRAMQLAATLREMRGSAHLMAVVATGITPAVAHAIRRPDMVSAFGYETPPEISDQDRAKLAEADELTDRILLPAYSVLSEDQGRALVAGSEAVAKALAA